MRSRTGRMALLATKVSVAAADGVGAGDARCGAAPRQRRLAPGRRTGAGQGQGRTNPKGEPSKPAPAKVGLLLNDSRAFQGYTLIAPMFSKTTYLIDMQGKVVRTWESDYTPGRECVPPRERAPAAPGCPATGPVRLRPGCRRPGSGIRLGRPARLGLQVCQREAVYRTTTSPGCPTATC